MKSRYLLVLLFFASPLFAQDSRDSAFLNARDAFRAGDANRFEKAAAGLGGNYDLAAYIDYFRLRMNLEQSDPGAIQNFLDRQKGSYLAEKLRGDWLRLLGKKARASGQWADFDAEYPNVAAPEQDLACYGLQSRLARKDKAALDEAQTLWLTLLEPPEPCQPVLEALIWEKKVLADDVWARVRRQFEANRPAAASLTMAYLPPSQTPDSKQVDAVTNRALATLLKLPGNWAATRLGRELAALGVQRVAANDPATAADVLERLQDKMKDSERQWAWSQIGLNAARRHLPQATGWYAKAGDAPASDEAMQWKVRAALRAQDWPLVLKTVDAMPQRLSALPEWTYWQGRAYRAAGRTSDANVLFERIADQPNFYGNLANDELGRPIATPARAIPPTDEELARAKGNPGLQRALTFFRLDLRTEGVKEWNWCLRGMNDRELLAAAELAKRYQIYDRAISTADRTKSEHDYSLRYLAPFGDQVRPAARNQALDDAWVYGLMRQESRFVTSAKSSAGASGLMQLMPATAKWVAKKIGLKDFNHGRVNETNTNLLLGTSYMRLVLESLGNQPVLASAAYNAGPGRARKWCADQPLEGAIYIETIPFNETRDYVKKVMSNSVYYASMFNGRTESLKTKLGVVGVKMPAAPKDADLP